MSASVEKKDSRPLVVSLCGTYLKAEMQSIYRQLTSLKEYRTVVYTERTEHLEKFPLDDVRVMEKRDRPRHKGNFLRRFWYKHVIKQWPPPTPIGHAGRDLEYYHPYDMVDRLNADQPALAHVYYGHKAVKYHEMLNAWGGPWIVSFHGIDVVKFFEKPGYAEEMKAMLQDATLVLARSESLLKRIEKIGCPPEKLRLNRTPVPLPDIEPKVVSPPPENQPWRIVQACRLIEKKGILTALHALSELKEKGINFTYTLCGTGPLESDIRKLSDKLGLTEKIRILGWVSQDQLIAEYQQAHLFLHPSELTSSEDQEGVPNSLLEAMCHGLPIVATNHGGIPEAVEDGKDGILVPEKSPTELAAALLGLMKDKERLAQLSKAAPNSAREKYGLPTSIAAMEACYTEAIESAKP